eukprot:7030487-Prymnesium_polylepis.1
MLDLLRPEVLHRKARHHVVVRGGTVAFVDDDEWDRLDVFRAAQLRTKQQAGAEPHARPKGRTARGALCFAPQPRGEAVGGRALCVVRAAGGTCYTHTIARGT